MSAGKASLCVVTDWGTGVSRIFKLLFFKEILCYLKNGAANHLIPLKISTFQL